MSNDQKLPSAAQITRDLFMVRPAYFGPNAQTAVSNTFQQPTDRSAEALKTAALVEFDGLVQALRTAGVRVVVIDDTDEPVKPDAVFPNNWVTTHANGDVFLFPLEAPDRRMERRMDIINALTVEHGFAVERVVDLSDYERQGRFLEGTGSMVLDRIHQIAYAAMSTRTHPQLLQTFASEIGYEICSFATLDDVGRPIYHTNVMLALGRQFAVVCSGAIADSQQRAAVLQRLADTGRQIIDITMEQMGSFAGNVLEVCGNDGKSLIILSQTAHDALTDEQCAMLQQFGRLLPAAVDTIEQVGGGSVRCMLAEIFLPVATPAHRQVVGSK
jgi:hypothetical protein